MKQLLLVLAFVASAYCQASTCPKPTGHGICVERCSGDASCQNGQKCCSNGCGHVCMDPVIIDPEPGSTCKTVDCMPPLVCVERVFPCFAAPCPTVADCVLPEEPSCTIGKPLPNIFCGRGPTRQDCPPETSCSVHPTDRWAVCCADSAHAGYCPAVKSGTVGTCAQECNSDNACPDSQKCCSNGCGKVCTNPVFVPPPEETCETKGCPDDQVCQVIYCIRAPCPPPSCRDKDCRDLSCGYNEKCEMLNGKPVCVQQVHPVCPDGKQPRGRCFWGFCRPSDTCVRFGGQSMCCGRRGTSFSSRE